MGKRQKSNFWKLIQIIHVEYTRLDFLGHHTVARKEFRILQKIPLNLERTQSGSHIFQFTSKVLTPDIYEFLKCTLKIDPKKRKYPLDVLKLPIFDAIRAVPRRRRSNGAEVPDLSKYTYINHLRESMALKPPGEEESTSEEEDDVAGKKGSSEEAK